jgi:hypothetical protein
MKHATPTALSIVSSQQDGRKPEQKQPDDMLMLFFLAFGLADPLH